MIGGGQKAARRMAARAPVVVSVAMAVATVVLMAEVQKLPDAGSWGLDVLDGVRDGRYVHPEETASARIYIIDSGIAVGHADFGGRATSLGHFCRDRAEPTATTASNFGVRSILLAERKAARAKAPVWMYEFAWETPAFDGKLKACHSVEVPFVFDTLKVIGERHQKPGAQALADKVSKTWATFARTGKVDWAPYAADKRTTMIFNDESKALDDPDKDVRPLWSKVATA